MNRKDGPKPEPLFDVPKGGLMKSRRPRAPRPVAWGNCGGCHRGITKPVGLLRQGDHLVWAEHKYQTWGHHKAVCPYSGAPLCQAPQRQPSLGGNTGCTH